MPQATIACVGDSLTAGISGAYNELNPLTYQYWTSRCLIDTKGLYEPGDLYFRNFGVPGAVMSQILRQLDLFYKAEWVIIMGGTNDFWMFSHATNQEQNRECVSDVVNKLNRAITKAKSMEIQNVALCTIPPVKVNPVAPEHIHRNILLANEKIKKISGQLNVHLVDVHAAMSAKDGEMIPENCQEDGVHFTESGNRSCGYAIAKVIAEVN